MSSTTTTQTVPSYSMGRTLADYDLHHSEPAPETRRAGEDQDEGTEERHNNPPTWETEYRRVPPHRPINRNIDIASRSITLNGAEAFFVYNMFQGIRIVEVSTAFWAFPFVALGGGRDGDGARGHCGS